uniref:Uncharacterized protein n=1 Tax=Alexandrium monilatum TaxID=311494 RepID=A0A7S4SZU7_9DINO
MAQAVQTGRARRSAPRPAAAWRPVGARARGRRAMGALQFTQCRLDVSECTAACEQVEALECAASGPDLEWRDSQALVNHKLLKAAREGSIPLIRTALEAGASLETRRPFVMTLDTAAATPTDPSNQTCGIGLTPLMVASEEGYTAAVEFLIMKRASVNAEDEDGMRPLHFAAFAGCPETCRALIRGGADPHAADIDGRSAMDHVPPQSAATPAERTRWRVILGEPTQQRQQKQPKGSHSHLAGMKIRKSSLEPQTGASGVIWGPKDFTKQGESKAAKQAEVLPSMQPLEGAAGQAKPPPKTAQQAPEVPQPGRLREGAMEDVVPTMSAALEPPPPPDILQDMLFGRVAPREAERGAPEPEGPPEAAPKGPGPVPPVDALQAAVEGAVSAPVAGDPQPAEAARPVSQEVGVQTTDVEPLQPESCASPRPLEPPPCSQSPVQAVEAPPQEPPQEDGSASDTDGRPTESPKDPSRGGS